VRGQWLGIIFSTNNMLKNESNISSPGDYYYLVEEYYEMVACECLF
jgi:hypothetical protein